MAEKIQIGEYSIQLPEQPPVKKIPGWNKDAHLQKWFRTELYYDKKREMDWEELSNEELLKKCPYLNSRGEPDYNGRYPNHDFISYDYVNPDMERFRNQEWDRRLNGYWFYNNGIPTWITGEHYFYLNYWKIDIGYPSYRSSDRKSYILWWGAVNDPDCYGVAEIMRRRQGKSWRSAERAFEPASRLPNFHSAMQSKERSAAQEWFTEKVVIPWKDIPNFFQPLNSSGTDPKTSMDFKADTKKGSKAKGYKPVELNSWIKWGPSTPTHFDGQKIHRYISDEFGKTVECDVVHRHYIVKKACTDIDKIIGKMYYITTVEDMITGGGSNAKTLWDESAPIPGKKRNVSGLWRYFQPAYEGYLIDEWGNDLIEESKASLLAELELLKGDPRKYNAQKRFMPFDIDDCWGKDGSKCHFNPEKLLKRISYLEALGAPLYETFSLNWVNNIKDTSVTALSNKSGRFRITIHPSDSEKNNVARDESGKPLKPNNKLKYVIGCDPFDHEFIADSSGSVMSNAASYCLKKFDQLIDGNKRDILKWETNRFVMEYIARPTPIEFYEDMIKACVYFGCQIHFERQKIGIRTHFVQRGYKSFLLKRPDTTYSNTKHKDKMEGTPNSPMLLNSIADTIDSYVSEDIFGDDSNQDDIEHGYFQLMDFPHQLRDMFNFDITATRKYDATIATGYTLIGAQKFIVPKQSNGLNHAKYFISYNQTGTVSEPNYMEDYEYDDDGLPSLQDDPYEINDDNRDRIMSDPYLRKEYGLDYED